MPSQKPFNSTEYFAHVLNSQHRFIRDTIKQLEDLLQHEHYSNAGAQDQLKTIRALILYLGHQLEYHFKTEEEHGIFPDLVQKNPTLQKKVQALFVDHKKLLEEIVAIGDITESVYKNEALDFEKLHTQFNRFKEHLAHHDEHETHLIMDVYNLDIGSMD